MKSLAWGLAALLVLLIASLLHTDSADARTGETEVRITARNADGGRVEFALQERDGSGGWAERILPPSRFFPDVDHTEWLNSSVVSVESVNVFARIIARNTASGSIEFGLQWGAESGVWVERILPERRFFPDIDHTRWLNSSPMMIGEAPVGSAGDGATATFGIFASGGDGSQEASAETRWTLRGPRLVAIQLGDRTTPTFEIPEGATVFLEFRESDTLEGGYGSLLIFPSGFELIIHPDTIDDLLARGDITDPVANAVIESIRRELSGAHEQTTTVDLPCHVVTEPFSSATVELAEPTCILARGAGTLTVRYSGFGPLTLTLPVGHPEWLIGVAGTSWTDGRPALYVSAIREVDQYLVINLTTGAEESRKVSDKAAEAGLNALFDAIAASVSN